MPVPSQFEQGYGSGKVRFSLDLFLFYYLILMQVGIGCGLIHVSAYSVWVRRESRYFLVVVWDTPKPTPRQFLGIF